MRSANHARGWSLSYDTASLPLIHLRDDPVAIAAYRDHHRRVWPEVIESLRRAGIRSMDIHLLGRTPVMSVEVADGVDVRRAFAAHRASGQPVADWEQLMNSLQEPSPDAASGEWWARMEPIFRLTTTEPAVAG
jgi:L-rhamnose mutarotase